LPAQEQSFESETPPCPAPRPLSRMFRSLISALLTLSAAQPKSVSDVSGLSGKCFESDGSGFVCSAGDLTVWDPDAPCGPGKAYIHAAPGASCAAMTAGAGKKVHTYRAAKVEVDYASFVGGCA
ncbi:unnamed protein product, partial [Symbiodinium sp. KB8]